MVGRPISLGLVPPMTHESWFIRHKDQVRGPLPASRIARLITLGHLRDSDDVSTDGKAWQPIGALRQQFTDLLNGAGRAQTWSRLNEVAPGATSPSLRHQYRDLVPSSPGRRRTAVRAHYIANAKPRVAQTVRHFAILAIVLAAIFATGILTVPNRPQTQRTCEGGAAPGVNWNNCRLEGRNLSYRNLSGANMRSARLRGATLSSTVLQRADLAYSELVGADLRHSNLRQAQLTGANLQGAKLGNADLRGADLAYADLSGADLGGANLQGTRLAHTIWVNRRICTGRSVGRCE